MKGILRATLAAGTTKTSTTEFFTDLEIKEYGLLNISICSGTATAFTLEVTKDGTNYGDGKLVPASGAVELTLAVKPGDIFNLRQSSGSTITFRWCDVIE